MDNKEINQKFVFCKSALIGVAIVLIFRALFSLLDIIQGRTWLHYWVVGDLATVLGWVFLNCGILSLVYFFPVRGFRSFAHVISPLGLFAYWGYVSLSRYEIRIATVEYSIVALLCIAAAIRMFIAVCSEPLEGNMMALGLTGLALGVLSCLGAATGLAAVVCATFPLLYTGARCTNKCQDIALAGIITGFTGDTIKWLGLHIIDSFWIWVLW